MTQHFVFKVEAITFQIAKHFFDPYSVGISLQCQLPIRKVCRQTPRFVFPNLPVDQQIHRKDLGLRQPSLPQPNTPASIFYKTPKISPRHLPKQTNMRATFLAHNIIPMPSFQLLQHFHSPKFAVANQQNGDSHRKKTSNVGQLSQLGLRCAVSSHQLNPCPGDRNSGYGKPD
jgi:hypothetical protein